MLKYLVMSNVNIIFLQIKCYQDRQQTTAANNDNYSSWFEHLLYSQLYLYYYCLYFFMSQGLPPALHILPTIQYFCMTGVAAPFHSWGNGLRKTA